MNNLPPQSPLSDQLRDRIGKRRVRVAVFLTYQFDPGFFETEVLQTLFDYDWSRNRRVALAQAEDILRQVDHIAVYYDQRGISETATSASLDYRRFGIVRHGGVFHPKNIFLLLEDHGAQSPLSLLLVTGSANLTRSGWWENLEAVHMIEICENSKSMLRDDLLGSNGLLLRVTQQLQADDDHAAIEAIRRFLLRNTESAHKSSQNGILRPRLFVGQQSLPRFLTNEVQIDPGEFNLEIISPYFDNTSDAKTAVSFINELNPRSTRIFLPKSDAGTALCAKEYYDAIAALPHVSWGSLPRSFTQYAKNRDDSVDRFVHAKVYRLFSPRLNREYLLVGSPNLTGAAHSQAGAGNFESAILFQATPDKRPPDWWLSPIKQSWQPAIFEDTTPEDATNLSFLNLSFRYDWRNQIFSYFWVKAEDSPRKAEVRHRSTAPFIIENIGFNKWIDLSPEIAAQIREGLKSSSFIDVIVEERPAQRVLVREEGMECKPSLAVTLSAEEILEYWSLFSPEQKSSFLSRKLEALVLRAEEFADAGNGEKCAELTETSMFDRFAGIFHAFSCLEGLIAQALKDSNHREARCLLFGSKYDSLKTLVDRITTATDADRVNRYVTLLCGKQLVDNLASNHRDFFNQEKIGIKIVQNLLEEAISQDRRALMLEISPQSAEFLEWFEDILFLDIPAPDLDGQDERD